MYPISDAAKALFESGEQRQVLRVTFDTIKHYENVSLYDGDTLIYRNGNSQNLKLYSGQQQIYTVGNSQIIEIYSNDNLVYTNDPSGVPVHVVITDSDVMIDGFSIDRYSCNGTKLEIGNAIAAEMKCKLDNRDGQYNSLKFEGVEMFVEVGIADWTQETPTITWIPCGYFTSDIQPRHLNTISLDMLDRMTKFDKVVDVSTFSMPDTVANIVSRCCTDCSVTMVTLPTLPNTSEIIPALPVIQQDITYRNLIQWCAGIMGTNAWIDWEGNLRFSWYNNTTNYISTIANRFESDLYENAITITGVKYTDTDDSKTVYIAGTDVYALDLSGNMLITADNADDILVGVYDVVYGFSYTPFTASVINAPYLWPMDRISYTDKHDIGHPTLLTNVNFGLNSATGLMGSGETKQTNGYAAPSGLTTSQMKALQRLRRSTTEAISDAVDNATAQITGADGGYVRFIYDANGKMTEIVIMNTDDITTATKVWRWNSGGLGYSSNGYAGPYTTAITQDGSIVANFITSGEMSANRISGGTIDGNTVNAKQLQIVDGNGNVIASFNNVITLGDANEIHTEIDFNSFEIKDENGDTFVVIGDIRNSDGYFEYTQTQTYENVPTGTAVFRLLYPVLNVSDIVSVYVNDTQTQMPLSGLSISQSDTPYPCTLLNVPDPYSQIQFHYSVSIQYKSYARIDRFDFGTRDSSQVIGIGSFVEGYNNIASGPYSHAEGVRCAASGWMSHAEGADTQAIGRYSHVEGEGTIAYAGHQHASGCYNVQDGTSLEIVGNGSALTPSNARTLSFGGNEWIAGTLTQSSDQRLKTETGEVPDVSDIKARRFKWNDKKLNHDDKEHIGYFAQDIEEVAPYLVDEDAMGYKSLDYNGILVAKIASLERRVAELENMLKKVVM